VPWPVRRPKDRISVLIITGDSMTSELLRNAFAHGRNGFAVDTITGSSQQIIGGLAARRADVALISEELQDGPQAGVKVLESLHTSQGPPAIMLLQDCKPEGVIDAFRSGARGIFYRTHSLKELSKCIRTVHDGQIWASNEDLELVITAVARERAPRVGNPKAMPRLTRREAEIVRLIAGGLKNREIAEALNVKEHSVSNHIYRIFEKLGVSSRVELVLYSSGRGKPS
jgi:two-component system nitrate/nitrite response regulator NarL